MHTATGPGIASIFVVIRESNNMFSLGQGQCALAQKAAMNMQFGGTARGKDLFPAIIHAKSTACGPLGS